VTERRALKRIFERKRKGVTANWKELDRQLSIKKKWLGRICGNLAQGDGLVTLMSQAPVTSSPRKKLRASQTIEIMA
jgi:hypothetical protein